MMPWSQMSSGIQGVSANSDLGAEHRVRLGRGVARLQLTDEWMVTQLQIDLQKHLEHQGTRAAMDYEQIHVARRLRLPAGHRAVEGFC